MSTWTYGMTTLNPLEPISTKESFAALPQLPRDEEGPVFAEPWQAQAFALDVKLSEQGHFTWKVWADALAEEIKGASNRGESDDGSHYYHYWLTTLERLVAAKGLSDSAELRARKDVKRLGLTRIAIRRTANPSS
jgi:nitrile hydratase accessory protein